MSGHLGFIFMMPFDSSELTSECSYLLAIKKAGFTSMAFTLVMMRRTVAFTSRRFARFKLVIDWSLQRFGSHPNEYDRALEEGALALSAAVCKTLLQITK